MSKRMRTAQPLRTALSCAAAAALLCGAATLADADHLLDHAFTSGGSHYVPMDIQTVELTLTLDAVSRTAAGSARVVFRAPDAGFPYLKMNAAAAGATLDGAGVALLDVATPGRETVVRALTTPVEAASVHTLELTYALSRRQVRLGGGRVGFLTAMDDFGPRGNFFEAYGPSSIEADAYAMTLLLQVAGARTPPRLFANGEIEELDDEPATWRVTFPDWYTTSSFYVHVTNSRLHVLEATVSGAEREIPVTVYSRSLRRAETAMAGLPALFAELEATYGPYLHDSFLALISGRGGMEHCGATVTSLDALAHELTHSWFARGVMPASGRDGWIDEAVASWRDYGYERTPPDPTRAPTNMAGFSVHDPFTPGNAYEDGRTLLAELDWMLAESHGGMRPLLAAWFTDAAATAVSTEDFRGFLETQTGADLGPMFDRFVYGEGGEAARRTRSGAGGHHERLSRAEIMRLR